MRSPFQESAPSLRAQGYSVIPLEPVSKSPRLHNWSQYCQALPSDVDHERWMNWIAMNAGVCLGPASGIFALDFDDDVDDAHGKILDLIPDSPVKKRGNKGFTAFYRYSGEKSCGHNIGKVRVLDVLSTGKQTVLPPSIHPNGNRYEWITPLTLADVMPDDLPTIPAIAMSRIAQIFRHEPKIPRTYHQPFSDTTHDDIEEALGYIDADDYDVWVRIGMALKEHLGEGAIGLWDRWSATGTKYDARQIPVKWRSFRRSDVTISSLFYLAMDRGYVKSRVHASVDLDVTILEGGNLKPHRRTEREMNILTPPGLVGRIAGWINETAIYPQPTLAVAAAIACVGAAMAHKVQSPTRLRTNFYTLGLAPSGAGKDHARKAVVNLLNRSGLDGVLGGEPASGAGLLTAIREGQGRCVILWDEFGRVLKTLGGKNASSHQSDVLRAMVELFSSASSVYAGVQYANHDGNMKRKPIDQPCLSIYGTTVPENFFGAMTSSDAIDGFLARFLVLESKEYTLDARTGMADINDPPEHLVAELVQWADAPTNAQPLGNLDGVIRINPLTVPYSAEAEALITDYTRKMRQRVHVENEKRSGLSSIFARAAEHAIKLSLVAHEGGSIGAEAMEWAIGVADYCSGYLAAAVQANVADNDFERIAKRVLNIISDGCGEWIPHAVLVRRTQAMNARTRGEVLDNLIEGGLIDIEKEKVEGAFKPVTRYRKRQQ